MPENDSQTVLVLLFTAVGLLLLLSGMAIGIHRRLSRIEKRLPKIPDNHDGAAARLPSAETSAGGAFEMFLGEDPARRGLPKAEQFTQYRKWRQEKGLNWSSS